MLLALTLAVLPAFAADPPTWPADLHVGTGAAFGMDEGEAGLGGFGFGRLLFRPRLGETVPLAVEVGARSGLLANDLREVTQIGLGLRWEPGLPYLRAGLIHAHETPWATLVEQPLQSIAGTAKGIEHRSGVELALGLHPTLVPDESDGRIGAFLELAAVVLTDAYGPPVYAQVDAGFSVGLGRAR